MKASAIIMAIASVGMTLMLHADPILYWMVDQSGDSEQVSFDIARVAWYDSTGGGDYSDISKVTPAGYATLPDENWSTTSGATAQFSNSDKISTSASYADLSSVSGYEGKTFFIELMNWDDSSSSWKRVGQSSAQTYDQLVSNGSVLASHLNVGGLLNMTVWQASGVGIPEPTSGLLMLIGGSLLALRRRRKVA